MDIYSRNIYLLKRKGVIVMKMIATIISIFLFSMIAVHCQPHTNTTVHIAIKSEQLNKSFKTFLQIKTDTLSSRLEEDADYLAPDVSDLQINLTNVQVQGDSMRTGDIVIPDSAYQRFARIAIVRVNDLNQKYGAMSIGRYKPEGSNELKTWIDLDMIEGKVISVIISK